MLNLNFLYLYKSFSNSYEHRLNLDIKNLNNTMMKNIQNYEFSTPFGLKIFNKHIVIPNCFHIILTTSDLIITLFMPPIFNINRNT